MAPLHIRKSSIPGISSLKFTKQSKQQSVGDWCSWWISKTCTCNTRLFCCSCCENFIADRTLETVCPTLPSMWKVQLSWTHASLVTPLQTEIPVSMLLIRKWICIWKNGSYIHLWKKRLCVPKLSLIVLLAMDIEIEKWCHIWKCHTSVSWAICNISWSTRQNQRFKFTIITELLKKLESQRLAFESCSFNAVAF